MIERRPVDTIHHLVNPTAPHTDRWTPGRGVRIDGRWRHGAARVLPDGDAHTRNAQLSPVNRVDLDG